MSVTDDLRDPVHRALRDNLRQLMTRNIEAQRQANLDELTGLNSRRRLDEYMMTEWRRARRDQAPFALLLAEVDYFRRYTDKYGQPAGDEALKRIGGAVQSVCRRPADLAARFGHEEFALVLPGTRANGLHLLGERLRQAVQALQIEHNGSFADRDVTLSIGGAATIPADEDGLLDLIESASRHLAEAKENGRNQVVVRE